MPVIRILALLAALTVFTGSSDFDAFDRTCRALEVLQARDGEMRLAAASLRNAGARPVAGADLAAAPGGRPDAAPFRDRALGPGYQAITVAPGSTFALEQVFFGGQTAKVAFVPALHAPFRIAVEDDHGVAQCVADASGRCSWMPLFTTRFRIALQNDARRTLRGYIVLQ